ncbi:endochitinase A [Drosophila rhopaloa]|uniref:Endochitinase A n=1 Tax=Drosophila rhopaloa TaxID=1041015 RepID=A0A6P4F8V0_DRORH|nr:endochitinase A [Drosophila rhopaloa]
MFTNWLTGNTSSSSTTPATRSSTSGIGGAGSGGAGGISASALVMSSPPDVILEVGPAPSSVRFVAHSLVLGMHSGYLRSAIRLDESTAPVSTNSNSSATTATGELLLYLSNVTADQFAPLLTYMYTGYLDLTVDNIFAVLLATHVLHMPRALEICRSFLARAQTEGYLNGNPAQLCPVASIPAKVIRPIPSKATMPNFGFLPMPSAAPPPHPAHPAHPPPPTTQTASLSSFGANSLMDETSDIRDNEEDEDVEVFIDSNTVTDNEADPDPDVDMDCNVSVVSSLAGSSAGSLNIERLDVKPPTPIPAAASASAATFSTLTTPKSHSTQSLQTKVQNPKRETLSKSGSSSRSKTTSVRSRKSSGLQVAKAPVPAAQLEMATATPITPSKFIIDVASCDGPVRFRRILNTAYGHKPENMDGGNNGAGSLSGGGGEGSATGTGGSSGEQHRSQQSVSYSFHQQMARAISSQQRQQLSHQQQEESENSGDAAKATAGKPHSSATSVGNATSGGGGNGNRKPNAAGSSSTSAGSNQELYVCVYCKHTFKSQYCYQKHAKRHLNPLSLTTTDKKLLAEPATSLASTLEADNPSGQSAMATTVGGGSGSGTGTATASATTGATSALLRREVRPLDMNVQYYPCKTCGSKFPSYYFVHKHRKMCHADEIEATATSNTSNNSSSNTSSSSSSYSSNSNKKSEATAATSEDQTPQQQQQQQQQQQHQQQS